MQPIKEWPESDRPREKLLEHGAESLSPAELLAIILRTGEASTGQSALDHGRALMTLCDNSFRSLAGASTQELCTIKGIGPAVQQKLHALGIKTFDDLAAADPETLAEQLKGRQPISQARVRSWTKAADQQTVARH